MARTDYSVKYKDRSIAHYYVYDDGSYAYTPGWIPWDTEEELQKLGLTEESEGKLPFEPLTNIVTEENRIPGRMRRIYQKGELTIEYSPQYSGERFSVYRRSADKEDPDYSPLPHDAPHYEGEKTPEGMREWANYYVFNKMDDGTYEAELDEAWWWGGGHNDGGTLHREIPEEWFSLSYDEFLEHVVTLVSAAHYGFTAEDLKTKSGLKEFFGFADQN